MTIPVAADAQCPATVVAWLRRSQVEQRCERADGHDGKHRATMHTPRRSRRRGPWVHEW